MLRGPGECICLVSPSPDDTTPAKLGDWLPLPCFLRPTLLGIGNTRWGSGWGKLTLLKGVEALLPPLSNQHHSHRTNKTVSYRLQLKSQQSARMLSPTEPPCSLPHGSRWRGWGGAVNGLLAHELVGITGGRSMWNFSGFGWSNVFYC